VASPCTLDENRLTTGMRLTIGRNSARLSRSDLRFLRAAVVAISARQEKYHTC
jgi:hypothetical protein